MIADLRGINGDEDLFVNVMEQATYTVNYAPMLACLFLACRMRVNWLTQGKGNPPTYIQIAMICTTYAILAMTLVAIVIPIFTGEKLEVNSSTGDLHHTSDDPHDVHVHDHKINHPFFQNTIVAICFTVLKYIIMIFLYIGAIIIIVGIITYKPPKGSWPGDRIPPPAPAVACTMILAAMYFLVYAGIQVTKTFQSFSGVDSSKLTGALQGAVCTMFFAPMLSILFIAARMRALQMDPLHGHPQTWAQNCFYACTYALIVQVILAITIPLVMGGSVKRR